ncbi:MAG: methyltransferase domain-containing protein [Candidatus Aminicenantes bacterium]|nr:methyltransferase domain-containing protein [Candidatus Aminicenantes bacterium]
MTKTESVLFKPEFPRSNAYDPGWVMENQMGPNALWLMEWLCRDMDLKPGMRVLDLGCGRAMTSIFLAREFRVQVWAADLWVSQDENWERIRKAGLDGLVYPLKLEAHGLPFPSEFFDAAASVDSYQYFGTDTLYLPYLSRFVKPRGRIGVVVPGLMRAFEKGIPDHLTRPQSNGAPFWEEGCASFMTLERWRELWEKTNRVGVSVADTLAEGWRYWRDFEAALERAGKNHFPSVAEALDSDQGRYIGFIRLIGLRKPGPPGANIYDPGLIAAMEKAGAFKPKGS